MFTFNLNSTDSSETVKPITSQNSLKILQQDKARWKVILALNLLFEIAILILYNSFNSKKGIEQQVAWCHTKRCEMMLNDHTESSLEVITYLGASFATFTLLGLVFESGYFMLINLFLNLICFVHSFRDFGDRNLVWALCLTMIFSQFIGTVIFIRKVRQYNEVCHRYDISPNILDKDRSHQVKLIPSTIGKSTAEQPTTPPFDYHEFVSNPGKYPKPRTTISFYSFTQILIPIVAIIVFLSQVKGISENDDPIKIYDDVQNLNISCETIQLLHLDNKISDCSLLSWKTPDQVKCVTNTSSVNSTDLYFHSRCTIQCSNETFTKVQDKTIIEWIKITQWLNIQSPGLSHSGDYSCYLNKINRTLLSSRPFEFTENPDHSCQYYDQCRSRICHQNRCQCHSANENYLPETGKCIPRKKLEDPCKYDEQCHFNAYQVHGFKSNFAQPSCISSKCQCPLGTVKHRTFNNQICISKASHGEPCFANAQCKSQFEYCFRNQYDKTDTCQCQDGYQWSQDECVPIRKCAGEKDCGDGQYCDQVVCRCKDGFGWKQGKCVQIRKCDGKEDCGDGQLCEQGVCWCKDGYRWSQDECVPIRKCAGEKDCGDGQHCEQGVCRCKDGFRWKLDECEPHRTCASNRDCEDGQHCEQNVCKCASPETMDSRGKCYNLQLQIALWLISIILAAVVLIFAHLLLKKFTTKSNSRTPKTLPSSRDIELTECSKPFRGDGERTNEETSTDDHN